MRRLPPLSAIEAFVEVARLGSIKAAAVELALSSPALSRRVQALERFIGKPLFERRHQAILLNAEGERLLAQIAPALDAMSDAVESMSHSAELLRLRLGVLPLYASQRLMPRLGELRRAHPQLHIDVDTGGRREARLGDTLDAAIILAQEVDPALYARRLDRNRVYVIGAKALIEGANPITTPEQLGGLTALVHRDMPDTFVEWRRSAGVPALEPLAVDHFDSGPLMLEAAAQGLGVAFMLEMHYEGARDPRLVRLFEPVASEYSYWFVCRPRALATRPVKIFHDWLVEVMGPEPAI
ncbi:LysR substrate-binding domain-containing protein [Sphingomonas qomolangmaensis]|uniref:LysR substrate-binding domain-containing protein n=1 Tax=Sphingomonas qomolangmaensis TaxID=2918765 RepID=A0ABY5L4R8_9SPHN|nr:LysR substrate-binding domain-containing protein [Sphingomonas qomolangmaensis]UUL81954.1 LysR substrate-binding domain-containing protein [Sphingomonas qomolangmaensis]